MKRGKIVFENGSTAFVSGKPPAGLRGVLTPRVICMTCSPDADTANTPSATTVLVAVCPACGPLLFPGTQNPPA